MKHDIIVKLTPEVKGDNFPEFLTNVVMLFSNLHQIPGVHEIHYFPNVISRDNRYDLMIEIDMEEEALEAYDKSVWHQQWKEQYGKYIEKKAIIDHI